MTKNRKYPRAYGKPEDQQQYVVDLGIPQAAGIVAGTLITGMTLGYLFKRWLK